MNAPAKPASMELKTLTLVYAISLLLSFIPPGCGFFGELSGNTHLTSPAPKPPDSSDLSPIHSPPAHQVPAKGRNPAAAATPPTSASSPSPPPARRIPATPPSPTPTHRTPATPSHSTPPSPTPTHRIPATPSHSTLDPKQLLALQSLGISTSKDPCSPSSPQNATVCDSGEPFRHVLSLQLRNCSDDIEISPTAMKALNTLRSLAFINCPVQPVRLPAELITNLKSFTCVHSLRKLTGVWLSRMGNLTDLRVEEVIIHASGLSIILSKMKNLRSVTISRTNLTGYLPRKWHLNITAVDLSGNELRGRIPIKITHLSELKSLNLSSNKLTGSIPSTIGDLLLIRNISLASNSLSGPIPSSMAEIPSLVHLDLSGNQFNGSVPRFLAEMKDLKYLNLENNNFQGPVPFNTSFIKKLTVFKVSGNSNLCYNHSIVSSKLKLGIARCDRSGFPIAPPDSSSQALSPDDSSSDDEGPDVQHKTHKHGPRNVVLGVAIALSSIIFLIIFFVLLSKCCKR